MCNGGIARLPHAAAHEFETLARCCDVVSERCCFCMSNCLVFSRLWLHSTQVSLTACQPPRLLHVAFSLRAGFLDMRGAVVNWFAKVAVSYDFANETVVAALSHFDRSVCWRCPPLDDLMLAAGEYLCGVLYNETDLSPLRPDVHQLLLLESSSHGHIQPPIHRCCTATLDDPVFPRRIRPPHSAVYVATRRH